MADSTVKPNKYVALCTFKARYGERVIDAEAGDILKLTTDEADWLNRDSPGRVAPLDVPAAVPAETPVETPETPDPEQEQQERAPDAPPHDRMVKGAKKR